MKFSVCSKYIPKKVSREEGFNLVELLMVCGLMVFVIGAVYLMLEGGYNVYGKTDDQIIAQGEARRNLGRMAKYIRQCKEITTAGEYELIFTSDIDDDDVPETVRFYLTDTNTKINQTVDGADATELGRSIRNVASGTPIFTYLDASGGQITDLGYARTASRSIKIKLIVDADPTKVPNAYELETTVQLRNFN